MNLNEFKFQMKIFSLRFLFITNPVEIRPVNRERTFV